MPEIVSHIAAISPAVLLILGLFVQIAPVKVNPISWLGKQLNKDTLERVDKLERHINNNRMKSIRWEILSFANSCKNHKKHSKDEFLHIIDIHSEYERLCEQNGFTNGVVDVEYTYILEVYTKCREEDSFI